MYDISMEDAEDVKECGTGCLIYTLCGKRLKHTMEFELGQQKDRTCKWTSIHN